MVRLRSIRHRLRRSSTTDRSSGVAVRGTTLVDFGAVCLAQSNLNGLARVHQGDARHPRLREPSLAGFASERRWLGGMASEIHVGVNH